MARPLYPVTLISKHQLSNNTIQLDFRIEGDSDFNFVAGQFIQFHFDHEGSQQKRSYSIANSPEAFHRQGYLEIALSLVENGLASDLFARAEVGFELTMGGPFGILTAPESPSGRLILAGTGTGLAPYRAMIPELQQLAQSGTPVTVIMGVRHRSDLIYEEEFRQFASKFDLADYRICYSRESKLDSTKNEFQGYVQGQFELLDLNAEHDLIYLCGNPAMIDDAAASLKAMGFASRQVKREKYVFSGH